jgi:predicted  nucleic acid-binding Zn-ribbon protein
MEALRKMAEHLSTIVELQQALDELGAAQELLGGIPDWMQELHDEHSERKTVIDSLIGEVDDARQARKTAESEINDLREKVKHFQEQISLVRNQREYGALLHEIDGAKQRIGQCEEQALAALETQEEATGRLEEEQESFKDLDARYAAELDKWEAQKPEVAHKAEELEARIEMLRERVPAPILVQFDRIRMHRQGQGLAPVHAVERGKGPKIWHCGACNYRVRPQVVVAIQTEGAIQSCDSCKRILYIDEESA